MDTDKEFANFGNFEQKINAQNCSIIPGLVDAHTHPVWDGDRINEFKMKVFLILEIFSVTLRI